MKARFSSIISKVLLLAAAVTLSACATAEFNTTKKVDVDSGFFRGATYKQNDIRLNRRDMVSKLGNMPETKGKISLHNWMKYSAMPISLGGCFMAGWAIGQRVSSTKTMNKGLLAGGLAMMVVSTVLRVISANALHGAVTKYNERYESPSAAIHPFLDVEGRKLLLGVSAKY